MRLNRAQPAANVSTKGSEIDYQQAGHLAICKIRQHLFTKHCLGMLCPGHLALTFDRVAVSVAPKLMGVSDANDVDIRTSFGTKVWLSLHKNVCFSSRTLPLVLDACEILVMTLR